MMTKAPTDEELMAYVDGELAPSVTARVLAHLNRTPALRQRLTVYSQSRTVLQDLYAGHASEPVPQRLIVAIEDFPVPNQATWLSSIKRGAQELAHTMRGLLDNYATPQLATVAALMLIAGMFVGRTAMVAPDGGTTNGTRQQIVQIGPVAPDSPLLLALTTTASGETYEWRGSDNQPSVQLTPVLSFQDTAQRFCRQFALSASAASSVSAVACLGSDKSWHIVSAATHANKRTTASGYQTASGPGSPEIAATLTRLMADVPLGLDEERQLIQSKWQAK